jgi:hypothetical protein
VTFKRFWTPVRRAELAEEAIQDGQTDTDVDSAVAELVWDEARKDLKQRIVDLLESRATEAVGKCEYHPDVMLRVLIDEIKRLS